MESASIALMVLGGLMGLAKMEFTMMTTPVNNVISNTH